VYFRLRKTVTGGMKKYKISLISYLNSRPFLYGLENSPFREEMELFLDFPSRTAEKMAQNLVDVGLVPVGSLSDLDDYRIVSDFCIGAEGAVRSVVLASDVPLDQVETILLDYQSRSTVLLVRVLAHFFWNREFRWEPAVVQFERDLIRGTTAGIVIGDRVFRIEKQYRYIYDLSAEWHRFTGLPFVFAVWATRQNPPEAFLKHFNEALELGISGIAEVEKLEQPNYPEIDTFDYFTRNISYRLDARKKQGMARFLELIRELPVSP